MTIYEIKRALERKGNNYFSRQNMRDFGQTMRDFKVKKLPDGRYLVTAPMRTRDKSRIVAYSKRYFNPATSEFEYCVDAPYVW